MYDMYPWDRRPVADAAQTPRGAIEAVQVALDRRDNGGDPAAAPGTPAVGPTPQYGFWHGFTND